MPEVAFRSDVAVFDIGQIFRSDPGRALEARGLSPNVILSSRSHQASCGFPLMIFILSTRLRSRCGLAPGCRLWVKSCADGTETGLPRYPRKQTFPALVGTSQTCQQAIRDAIISGHFASNRYVSRNDCACEASVS